MVLPLFVAVLFGVDEVTVLQVAQRGEFASLDFCIVLGSQTNQP
jgi:hypothetical protein